MMTTITLPLSRRLLWLGAAALVAMMSSSTAVSAQGSGCHEHAPDDGSCPAGTFCDRWFDGCNECTCHPSHGRGCTRIYCFCQDDQTCPPPSCLDNAQCLPVPVEEEDEQEDVFRFNFRFGFFADTDFGDEIPREDVEGVICQTQYFMSHLVQNATNSKSVHVKATEIDWEIDLTQDLPVQINFTVQFTDAALMDGDNNNTDTLDHDHALVGEMEKLGQEGLRRFIMDWVWHAEPTGLNFFENVNRMAFDGVQQTPVQGQLDEAECPETIAPTMAPTAAEEVITLEEEELDDDIASNITFANMTNSSIIEEETTNTTASDDNYDGFIRVDFRFGFFDDDLTPDTELLWDDVEGVLCQAQAFFERVLYDSGAEEDDVSLTIEQIDYAYFEALRLPAQVNFTLVIDEGGSTTSLYNQPLVETLDGLSPTDWQNFIIKYVWDAPPEGLNFFENANRLAFNVTVSKDHVEGERAGIECPAVGVATSRRHQRGDDILDALP